MLPRYVRKAVRLRPIASERVLGDAVQTAARDMMRLMRATDGTSDAVIRVLREQQDRYALLAFPGHLRPAGSKKPSDASGSTYWQGNESGLSGSGDQRGGQSGGSQGGDRGGQSGGSQGDDRICFTLQNTGRCDKEKCPYRHVAAVGGGKSGKSGKGGKGGRGGGRGGQPDHASQEGVQSGGKSVGDAALPGAVAEPAAASEAQRGDSPRRERCQEGADCPNKAACTLWHPSPKKSGGGSGQLGMTSTWFTGFADVEPRGTPENHSLIATSAPASPKSPVLQKVRALSWGRTETKLVDCTPEGEEAPKCGELNQHDHAASNQLPRAAPALRGGSPKEFLPFPEFPDRLLTKSKTGRLWRYFRKKTFTPAWLRMSGDERRYFVVEHGCSWVQQLSRFFASCLHWGLPIKSNMLQEWNRITKSDAPVRFKDRTRLPVAAVSSATAQPGSGVAPVAEPAAAAPSKAIDMRAIESACDAKLAPGVYLVDQDTFNCVDSGSSLEAMTGAE